MLAVMCRFVNCMLRDLAEYRSDHYDEYEAFGRHNLGSPAGCLSAERFGCRGTCDERAYGLCRRLYASLSRVYSEMANGLIFLSMKEVHYG